jgi:ankyrin repeat protein
VQNGFTALIKSAQNGHVEVARLLLDSRADIHAATQVRRAAQGVRTRPANLLPVNLFLVLSISESVHLYLSVHLCLVGSS